MRRPWLLAVVLAALLCAAAPAEARTLVRYDRSGGFAGFDDHLTVTAGGQVTVVQRTRKQHFSLPARRLLSLRKLVRNARFTSLRARYGPAAPVPDGITETARHAGHAVTVTTGGDPPARLERLLERLRRLLSDR